MAHIAHNPQLEARGYFAEVEHDELGRSLRYPAYWGKSSEGPVGIRHRAPSIGEHNEFILKELFGLSDDEVADLVAAEVLEST